MKEGKKIERRRGAGIDLGRVSGLGIGTRTGYRDWVSGLGRVSGLGIGIVCMIPLIGQRMVVEYHISALINE